MGIVHQEQWKQNNQRELQTSRWKTVVVTQMSQSQWKAERRQATMFGADLKSSMQEVQGSEGVLLDC